MTIRVLIIWFTLTTFNSFSYHMLALSRLPKHASVLNRLGVSMIYKSHIHYKSFFPSSSSSLLHKSPSSLSFTLSSHNDHPNNDLILPKAIFIKPKSSSKKTISDIKPESEYPFNRDDLPDETIFIIDGTSLIFRSYFSQTRNNYFLDAKLSEQLTEKLINEYKYEHPTVLTDDDGTSTSTSSDILNDNAQSTEALLNEETKSDIKINVPEIINESTKEITCSNLITLASQLVQLIDLLKPRYLVIAFDAGGKTFRHKLLPSYKQHRPLKPADMELMFLLAPRIFEIFGCRCIKQDGYEADDIMATIGEWAHQKGLNVIHVSPDKDMLQCVASGIHAMIPRNQAYLGVDDVTRQTEGIPPNRLCDFWALTGDNADNIPGVRWVGDKVGVGLIKYFKSIEEMQRCLSLIITPSTSDPVPTYTYEEDEVAISLLTKALKGVRCSKLNVWTGLKEAAHGNKMALYKDLVTLRKNVPLTVPIGLGFEKFVAFNQTMAFTPRKQYNNTNKNSTITNISSAAAALAETAPLSKVSNIDINTYSSTTTTDGGFISSARDLTHIAIGAKSTPTTPFSSVYLENITTSHFRYRGERAEDAEMTIQHINEISTSLLIPLKSLRYIYRKLDREL